MIEQTFSEAGNGDRIRDRLTVFSNNTMYGRGIDVLIALTDFRGDIIGTVEPLVIVRKPAEQMAMEYPVPTFSGITATEFLQSALNAAWSAGMRPTNWRDERPGEIKRMEDHLADMRRLVFAEPPLMIGEERRVANLMEKAERRTPGAGAA